jgi:2',3'-cyclic-nucleotide 2'-phosphodiesterase (5'-nucleotidase family)
MKKLLPLYVAALVLGTASCSTLRNQAKDNGKIEAVFVQVNDVYEIAPLSGGKEGGMARVATLKKKYLQQNPNTFLVMAGDFVSPSVYNSLQYQGKAIRGRQMVEAMNAAGMDIAVFGNHEFDIKESELQDRINESEFQWVSSNTFHKKNNQAVPFAKTNVQAPPVPKTFIKTIRDSDGTTARIGFIGLTLPFNRADYVSYTDPLQTAKELYNQLKDSVDAVVAITHQAVEEDIRLAREIPGLAVILGGHEHDRRFEKVGKVYVTKAHANAKSAYVVKLKINKKRGRVKADPELEYINENISLDPATDAVVKKWVEIAANNYGSLGFDVSKVVVGSGEPLDGRETAVRTGPTNLTRLIVSAMQFAAPKADVALMNGGSIRVDDILPVPVSQYDIIRSLPFGGGIREADMKGSLLIQTLNQGRKNAGTGGFLLYNDNLQYDAASGTWKLSGTALDPAKTYRVAMTEFLFTGKEANLDYLNPKNPDVVKSYEVNTSTPSPMTDIRLAIIRYMEGRGAGVGN